ncbi:transcriptional regulator [Aureisphaera galaxeae]|uniref:transcriptional regulator n=1 Tax=Aureisphaera galaxeae TaxID=1538023 RepID=UPI0023503F1C|nr:transcriptional regulator [Aureisphaera galaxeae]MDC8002465.1 transcriptional regulator [Aureisphaera galaxeae]
MTPKTIVQRFCCALFFMFTSTVWCQAPLESLLYQLEQSESDKDRLATLDSVSEIMARSQHEDRSQYLNECIQLAKAMGDYDMAALKARFIIQDLIHAGRSDSALYVIDKTFKDSSYFKNEKPKGILFSKKGTALFHAEDLEGAVNAFERAATILKATGDYLFEADSRYFAGQIYAEKGDFVNAVKRYKEAYELYEEGEDQTYANYVRTSLANTYDANNFIEKANEERLKVIEAALPRREFETVSANYLYMSDAFEEIGDWDNMNRYLQLALQYGDSIASAPAKQLLHLFAYQNLAAYHIQNNNLKSASIQLQKADSVNQVAMASKVYENNLILTKVRFFLKAGSPDKAWSNLNEMIQGTEQLSLDRKMEVEDLLAQIHEANGDHAQAFVHLKNYQRLKDSIENTIKTNTLLFYQSEFESEHKENEIYRQKTAITLLEKEQEIALGKRRTLVLVLILVVLLSVMVAYYIWLLGRKKRKAMAKAFEERKQELQDFAQELIRKTKEHETLLQELKRSNITMDDEHDEELDTLQELSSSRILTEEDWDTFKQKFVRVYPHFFVKMKKKGLQLTKSEERLLALEKLQLQTSEIANMLGISPNSVLTARYRLKKKINLSKEASLVEFVES